jgi:D-glycero-D-manno-heptose 1,7-bisphosphate phosphatase
LDRDGTIILDKNYLSRIEDIEYYPDSIKAIQLLQQLGHEIFIVTNQSGVGRGYFSLEQVHLVHAEIQKDLHQSHLKPITDFAICPHAPEDKCLCRKPSGQMILELIKKYHLDPDLCYMVGDKLIDAQAASDAGIKGVLIRQQSNNTQFPFFKTLLEFAQHVQENLAHK